MSNATRYLLALIEARQDPQIPAELRTGLEKSLREMAAKLIGSAS